MFALLLCPFPGVHITRWAFTNRRLGSHLPLWWWPVVFLDDGLAACPAQRWARSSQVGQLVSPPSPPATGSPLASPGGNTVHLLSAWPSCFFPPSKTGNRNKSTSGTTKGKDPPATALGHVLIG